MCSKHVRDIVIAIMVAVTLVLCAPHCTEAYKAEQERRAAFWRR